MEQIAALSTTLNGYGRQLVELSNPELAGAAYEQRATKGWAFVELDAALYTAVAYGVLVAYGVIKRAAEGGKETSSAPREKGKAWSLGGAISSLNAEPVKWLQLVYNLVQVVLCAYMMGEAARVAYVYYEKPVCNAHNPIDSKLAPVLWLFYVSKVLDFFDTFFIIFRSKWTQFSFLHIYHHFSIFLTYWLVANAAPDGDVYYTIIANSFVHLVMYAYYFFTTIGISPWWGRNLTQLQMGQFITMNVQAITILLFGCPYPNRVTAYYLFYIITLFALFLNFYLQKYNKKGGDKKKAA